MESIFETKEQYQEFIKQWKEITNSKKREQLTLEHFILYRLFKGKDWKVCLSESSRTETIARAEHIAEKRSPKYLSLWPFGDTITPEMIEAARMKLGE